MKEVWCESCDERVNKWEQRLSLLRERNTHKQWRADNEEMKRGGGTGLRANDGKDFKAPALAASKEQKRRSMTGGQRIQQQFSRTPSIRGEEFHFVFIYTETSPQSRSAETRQGEGSYP